MPEYVIRILGRLRPPLTVEYQDIKPPITLLLQEYQVTLLLRALRHYKPTVEEADNHSTLLEILEMIAIRSCYVE